MNWEAVTVGVEIIGLVVVLATLVYLAIELRQNTASVNTARYETITTGFNDIDEIVVADPDLAQIFLTSMTNPESLNEKEQARTAFLFRMFHNQYHKIFHLYRTGVLAEEEWVTYAKQCGQILGTPGGRAFLKGNTDYPDLLDAVTPYMDENPTFDFTFTNEAPSNEQLKRDA